MDVYPSIGAPSNDDSRFHIDTVVCGERVKNSSAVKM